MKRFFVLISLLAGITSLAYAQPRPVVASDIMNVLYAGIDNPISVAVPGQLTENMQINCATATVVKKDDIHFTVCPAEGARQADLHLFSLKGTDTVHLGQVFFKVIPGPEPLLLLGGTVLKEDETPMLKGVLISTPVLMMRYPESFPLQLQAPLVVSYDVIFPDNPDGPTVHVNGSRMNEEALKQVKAAAPGNKIIFSDIKMSLQGRVRALGSYIVVLK